MSQLPSNLRRSTLAMRFLLEERGIDLIEMQMAVYRKAMDSYDSQRGLTEKNDPGAAYLGVANQAVATLVRYAFPTLTNIKPVSESDEVSRKILDASEVRRLVLDDPFAKSVVAAVLTPQDTGLPVLTIGIKKNE